jgi:hypothetical protein
MEFNANEILSKYHSEPVDAERKRDPNHFPIDELLTTHIAVLMIKAGVNDSYEEGLCASIWKRKLKTEKRRILAENPEAPTPRIDNKIAEINFYLNTDPPSSTKSTEPIKALANQDKRPSKYEQRKESFNEWRNDRKPDIDALTVEIIFEQIKQYAKNKSTWNIRIGTFRREFWQQYCGEEGTHKSSGRPPKR